MTQTGGSGGPEPAAGGAPDSSVAVSTGPESEQAAAPEAADLAATASPDLIANSLGEYARIWWRRVRAGESGALPVVIGLIVIVVYFQVRNSLFLSAGNLVNLITQAAFIVTFGMAEVFVLLLGEIDLSVGYNAALGAVITLWMLSSNLPLWLAVVTGLAFSAAFAGLEGVIITRLRLPSFVVTLAGYLGRVRPAARDDRYGRPRRRWDDPAQQQHHSLAIEGGSMSLAASWIVMIVAVVLTGAYMVTRDARRRTNNLVRAARQRHLPEDRADGGRRRDRRADLQPEPRRRVHGRGGRALGRARRAGPARRLDHPAEPDPARPLHLRDRRERRGRTPGGHQPEPDPRHRVRAVRPDRRDHRHHLLPRTWGRCPATSTAASTCCTRWPRR